MTCGAIGAGVKSCARPAPPRRAAGGAPGRRPSRWRAAASASTSPGGHRSPSTPSVMTSAGPPASEAMTASPAAMPSTTTWPKGSGSVDACTSTSRPRNSVLHTLAEAAELDPSLQPEGGGLPFAAPTLVPLVPEQLGADDDGLAPPSGKALAKASRKTCWPFQGSSRPTMPTRSSPVLGSGPDVEGPKPRGLAMATPPAPAGPSVASVVRELAMTALGSTRAAARTRRHADAGM